MHMMTDYRLQPHTRACALTGRELQPGEKFYTALFDENGAFHRRDYSAEAWEGPPEGAFSFWMGHVPSETKKARPVFDDELLLECFGRLEGQTDPHQLRFRYVVALLLVRRKRLVLDRVEEHNGVESLALHCPRTGKKHEVQNPGLADEEIATVQDEIFELLGWN